MLKRIVVTFTILTVLLSTVALAAPATVSVDDQGTANGLIVITNPDISESNKVSTTTSDYIISGYGQEGTDVCIYLYNPTDNVYKKIVIDGKSIEWEIGASGLFMQTIALVDGENKILIRAEADSNTYQIVKIDITLLKEGFLDRIKGLTIDIVKEKVFGIGK